MKIALSCLLLTGACVRGADEGLKAPVEEIVIGKEAGVEQVVRGQKASSGRLVLVPDTCFFSGDGKLRLTGTQAPAIADPEMNGGKSFSRIEGLARPSEHVVWPLRLTTPGDAKVSLWCANDHAGLKLDVRLGDQTRTITLATSDGSAPQVETAVFSGLKPGNQELSLSVSGSGEPLQAVRRAEVSGAAIHDALLLRARWRPAAVHGKFDSAPLKAAHEQARLWVMEERPVRGEKGFYAPVTTPFGYFGSTYEPDDSSGGINFSMWSYGANSSEPAVDHLSHLLAAGDPAAKFGRFDGEGHGVKLRDWNPYQGQQVVSTVLALRVDPGETYDTYTGYYLDQKTRTWHLYASGRKWVGAGRTKRATDLLPGCFVEVPGPPDVQRTGQIVRAADFRGWCRDTQGKWHPIDQLHGGKRDASRDVTNSLWTTTPDGWVRLGMGGMVHYRYGGPVTVQLSAPAGLPDYMAPERLAVLDKLPTVITLGPATRADGSLKVAFDLTGPKSRIKAVYGPEDDLSFVERWKTIKDLGEMEPGHHEISLPDVPASGFCRLIATNPTGTFVTPEPAPWK